MKFRKLSAAELVHLGELPAFDHRTEDDLVADLALAIPEHFADLTITEANVSLVVGSGSTTVGPAGAALTIGQPVYWDGAAWQLADADAAGKDVATGITMSRAAAIGQLVVVAWNQGPQVTIGFGAILTAGETYIVSATPGKIAPITDAATGWKVCILGIAISTANLKCCFFAGGTAHA